MPVLRVDGMSIDGVAACVPQNVVDNADYGQELYGKDLESVIKVTGVNRRRLVAPENPVTALDLCVKAAEKLRAEAAADYSQFGGLVFVTMTPDYAMPDNASHAHGLLRFSAGAPAIDIRQACSGYPYGLWVGSLMAQNTGKKVLLLDGDTHSAFVSPHDRSTSLIFGDGGSATVLSPTGRGEWYFNFTTVTDRESLVVPDSGFRNRFNEKSLDYTLYPDGSRRRNIDLTMDGLAVFSSVIRHAPVSLKETMQAAGMSPSDYDYLLLHQANLMMIKQIAGQLKFERDRFPHSLEEYGNIGSASIPLNICARIAEAVRTKNNKVLLSAFGAGFSMGTASIDIGPCACCDVFDY